MNFPINPRRMTVDERAKINGGFVAGPGNRTSNDMIRESAAKQQDTGKPPNLRDVGSDMEMCGNCMHYEEGEGCKKFNYPCSFSDTCDAYEGAGGGDDEEMEGEEEELVEAA